MNKGNLQLTDKLYLDTKTEFSPKRSKEGCNLGTIQKMLGNSLYKRYSEVGVERDGKW